MVLKSIHPPDAAKFASAIGFVVSSVAAFTLWLFPFSLLSPKQHLLFSLVNEAEKSTTWGLVFLPLLGTGLAFLFALAAAGLYNLMAQWLGGIRMEVGG